MDNEALELDPEQLSDIAKPIAHMADRSKLAKKYGRVVIDSSDGVIAMIQLAMWTSRVNRIARKYRNMEEAPNGQAQRANTSGEAGRDVEPEPSSVGVSLNGAAVPGFGYN